jgi:gamma-glutamylcyclotransferase (GGCT)/AIG2-like uncharacterized protein YtfP
MSEFEFIGRGKMIAVMYDIGNYPGAVRDQAGNEVDGELYRLRNEEKILDMLDRYEGYDSADEKVSEYIRRKTSIRMDNGGYQMAWVYWYNGNLNTKQRIRQNDYLDYLKIKSAGFMQE